MALTAVIGDEISAGIPGAIIPPPGNVLITPGDAALRPVTAVLYRPVPSPLPRPKIATIDRPKRAGLTEWVGRDPYELVLPLKFDGYAKQRSVEPQVRALVALALRHQGRKQPPVVAISGPVPEAQGGSGRWRISSLDELDGGGHQTLFLTNGDRCRVYVDVTLLEYTTDDPLDDHPSGRDGKGVTDRKTAVQPGETSLMDVARRVYGGRNVAENAKAIARANPVGGKPMRLGARIGPPLVLRLP